MKPRSLILAAHGSLAESDSNQPLFDLAARIAAHEKFDVVTPAFLNGQPEMTNVLDRIQNGDWSQCEGACANGQPAANGEIVIVPVMTSEGYYLKKLPSKFAENISCNQHHVTMTPVIGVHPSIPTRSAQRISFLSREHKLAESETTVAIIGHGTRRNKNSGVSTIELTEKLRESFSGTGLKFKTGFLDQDPEACLIAQEIETPNTLIIPFLISRGPHTTEDVPNAFELPAGPDLKFPLVQRRENGIQIYDFPLAMYPSMDELCLDLAIEQLENGSSLELERTNQPPVVSTEEGTLS